MGEYDLYTDMKQLQKRFRNGFWASPHSTGQAKADRELLFLWMLQPWMIVAAFVLPWVIERRRGNTKR